MPFDPDKLKEYQQAAKEAPGIETPRSPIEERQERISALPFSAQGAGDIARFIIPTAIQAAAEVTPIGRVARFGQAVQRAAPYLKDVGGGLLGYETNVALGLEQQGEGEMLAAGGAPLAGR